MKSLVLFAVGLAGLNVAFALEFGYTEPNRVAKAAFPEMGVIAEIAVEEGDRVTEGQVLAKLNSEILQQDLRIATEQLRLQRLRYDQIKAIHQTGSGSKEEEERAKSDLEIASLRVERIRAQIDDRTLRAPFTGLVTKISREVTESVSAAQTEVMTVVQLDSLRVTLHLPAAVTALIAPDQEVELVLEQREKVRGRAKYISPVTDAASGTVRVTFVIPNPEGKLRSGVRCELGDEQLIAAGNSAGGVLERTEMETDDAPLPVRRPRAGSASAPARTGDSR